MEVFTSWLEPEHSQFYNEQLKDPNLSPDDREKYEEQLRISKQQADWWINFALTKIAYAVNKINTMIKAGSERGGLKAELSDYGQPKIIGSDEKEYSFPKDFVTKNMGGLINLTNTDDLIYRDPPQLVSYINKRIQKNRGEK